MSKLFDHSSTSISLNKEEVLKYNEAHEKYFLNFANREYEKNKPFGNPNECSDILYRMGMLLSGAKIGRSQKIGELGCGGGWLSNYISKLGNEMHLMDVSNEAINISKELFAKSDRNKHHIFFHTLKDDVIKLPDNYLDRIIVHDALHHIPNPQNILKECYRVLKNGGIVGLSECGPVHSKIGAIIECREKTGILERDITLNDLEVLAEKSGFSEVKIKPYLSVNQKEIELSKFKKLVSNDLQIIDNSEILDSFSRGDQTIAFFYKGNFTFDTTYPNKPEAEILLIDKKIDKDRVIIELQITNTGDTIFLTKRNELGAFCKLGCHLNELDGRNIVFDFLHQDLTNFDDIKPNEKINIKLNLETEKVKNKILEFDLIIEGVCWLSYMGSKTLQLKM